MITFTGLVFSITIVVLQLASAQFSPRVLRMFLRDRTIRLSLGVFLGSFVYAIVVLRSVKTGGAVPRISLTGSFAFVLLAIGMFIRYVAHIVNMIRAASIIATIGGDARVHLERHFPPGGSQTPAPSLRRPSATIASERQGVLVAVNEQALVELAEGQRCLIAIFPSVGDYVARGMPLAEIHGAPSGAAHGDASADGRRDAAGGQRRRGEPPIDERALREALSFDNERTLGQDLPFAFRELVDIAQRSLSPAVNDPTTAVQAIDAMHDLLRRLCSRSLGPEVRCDGAGTPRLVVPQLSFAGYLGLAVGQVWHYGRDAVQVPQRLTLMLTDLAGAAIEENAAPIERWLAEVAPIGAQDPPWQTMLPRREP